MKIHDQSIVCNHCKKVFSSNQALKRHDESVHETKSFQCEKCKKQFSTLGNLKRHEKIHLL